MNGSDLPHLHAYRDPANADDLAEAVPCADAHTLIANLKRIGKGAAAQRGPKAGMTKLRRRAAGIWPPLCWVGHRNGNSTPNGKRHGNDRGRHSGRKSS